MERNFKIYTVNNLPDPSNPGFDVNGLYLLNIGNGLMNGYVRTEDNSKWVVMRSKDSCCEVPGGVFPALEFSLDGEELIVTGRTDALAAFQFSIDENGMLKATGDKEALDAYDFRIDENGNVVRNIVGCVENIVSWYHR